MEIVHFYEGDRVKLCYPDSFQNFRLRVAERAPQDAPPEKLVSFTFVHVSGDAAARYLRSSTSPAAAAMWSPVDCMVSPTKFLPCLSSDATELQPPVAGTYLIFGRVLTTLPVNDQTKDYDSGIERTAFFQVKFPFEHVLSMKKLVNFVHGNNPEIPDPGAFFDVLHLESGCKLSLSTLGQVCFDKHGNLNYSSSKLPWQSLTLMRLSSQMTFDRYEWRDVNGRDGWARSMPRLGTSGEPIFQVHENTSLLIPESASPVTVLLLVSFPSIAADGMGMAISVNEDAIAMSQMLARSDLYSGLFHNFYEVVELEPGDTVSVSLYWIDDFELESIPPVDGDFHHGSSTGSLAAIRLL